MQKDERSKWHHWQNEAGEWWAGFDLGRFSKVAVKCFGSEADAVDYVVNRHKKRA